MLLVPRARAPMQRSELIGLLCYQMSRENLGKQVVIAIPLAPVIQRNDKEVAAMERLQPRTAVVLAGDGIAQRATQPFENGGLEQEAANQFGLTLQHLFDQIVHNVAVVAGKRPDELGTVIATPHGEGR